MSRSSTLPAHGTPVFEPSPDYRTLLEEHWRRQVATITELSFAALTPEERETSTQRRERTMHNCAAVICRTISSFSTGFLWM